MKTSSESINWELGCRLPISKWAWLNKNGIFEDASLRRYTAPFPPVVLINNVSGLVDEKDFATHGVDIFQALAEASPKPILEFKNILDFGCGCGRLARMFKGHSHKITACDVDPRHIQWMSENLDYVYAVLTATHPPLPFKNYQFDAIISISVFSHLNEESQDQFLSELSRITKPEGHLFLTIHGARALKRAKNEEAIWRMLDIDKSIFDSASDAFENKQHAFILQHGHLTKLNDFENTVLTTKNDGFIKKIYKKNIKKLKQRSCRVGGHYEYGIAFIPEDYVLSHWSKWFNVLEIRSGAIHDFQDIVLLKAKS